MRKIIYSIIILGFAINSLFAQHDNTLYFMNAVPQSSLVNPAVMQECKVNVHGMLVPIVGQIPPPISFNLGNNGFSLKKALKPGAYLTVDDTTHFDLRDSLTVDFDYLLKAMKPVNFITTDLQINLIGGGIRLKDYYISFDVTEKINMSFGYPRDLIGLIWWGNGHYMDKPANLSGLGLNFTHYREYAVGVATKLNDKFDIGGRAKLLFGKVNMNTRKSDFKIYTDPTTFDMRVVTNMEFNMSLPDSVLIDYSNQYHNTDSLKFDLTTGEFNAKDYLLKRKNAGFAIDLGATYTINEKVKVTASVIDLGFIKWKSNTYTFKQDGDFTFKGIDGAPYLNPNDTADHLKEFADSIYREFEVESHNKAYYTWMPTKIYIGGQYKYNDYVNFSGLVRTEIYQRTVHSSVTVAANTNFTKWFAGTLSYSVINRNWLNIGLGIGLKGGPLQLYIMSDNIVGWMVREKSSGAPIPYGTRNMNIRFGANLIFGCPKNSSKSYL